MTVWGTSGTEPPLCLPQSRLNGALWHKGALTMGRTLVCRASPSALSLSHSPGRELGRRGPALDTGAGAELRLQRSQPTGAPLGRQGRDTRLRPPNRPLARKDFLSRETLPEDAPGQKVGKVHRQVLTQTEALSREGPSQGCRGLPRASVAGRALERNRWQSEPTHFMPQFSHLFKGIVWA